MAEKRHTALIVLRRTDPRTYGHADPSANACFADHQRGFMKGRRVILFIVGLDLD